MFALLVTCVTLSAEPEPAPWQKQESAHLANIKQITTDFARAGEGYFSPDGKTIIFQAEEKGTGNPFYQIFTQDLATGRTTRVSPGAGKTTCSFFSPDGKRVIFRSDRKKKDHLQLYVINTDGSGERALTDDLNWVQWGPYWYKDGKHIIYAAADHSNPTVRPNYDLYWMNVDSGSKKRITFAPGADVLPVFSPDGDRVMWTSTRDGRQPAQLYIADFTPPKEE